MLFGRRKPGFTDSIEVEGTDAEAVLLAVQDTEKVARKKPKADTFDLDRATEIARKTLETSGSMDVARAEMLAGAPEAPAADAAQGETAVVAGKSATTEKPELLAFLASQPERANEFADQPTVTAPPEPELSPAQQLAGYIRERSTCAEITPYQMLLAEVEDCDALIAQFATEEGCGDIVTRQGTSDLFYYSSKTMSNNYAMIATYIADKNIGVTIAEMTRFNAKTYPSATPVSYFTRSPYFFKKEEIEAEWQMMQGQEMFADIEMLRNNENTPFFFSTNHLSRRYATALSDVDLYCD